MLFSPKEARKTLVVVHELSQNGYKFACGGLDWLVVNSKQRAGNEHS